MAVLMASRITPSPLSESLSVRCEWGESRKQEPLRYLGSFSSSFLSGWDYILTRRAGRWVWVLGHGAAWRERMIAALICCVESGRPGA